MRWEQVYLSEPRISLKGSPCLVAGLLRIVAKIPLPLVWSKSWKPFLKLMFLFLPSSWVPQLLIFSWKWNSSMNCCQPSRFCHLRVLGDIQKLIIFGRVINFGKDSFNCIWPWFDHCPLSVTDTWVRRAFGSVFCCNVLQCFQKKCDMLQSCFSFFPKCSAVYEGWLSVCLVTKNIDFQRGDRMFFKSCLKISSWCALPYNSEVGVETFDKFSADSLSAFKLILLSHLGIIFSFSNRKDAISKTCNIQYTNSDWMGWSFNVVNVQI